MIQTVLVAIPGILALIVCLRWGPERALLNVYLPVLLLLPEYPWPISGQFSFTDLAILPIAAFLLYRSKLNWKWNSIDFVVIGYMVFTAIAEGMNKGYKEGTQNMLLQDLFRILLPYLVAKQMFRHPQFAVDAAKRIVVLLAIVAIVSVYEFRMGSDLFTSFLSRYFYSVGVVFRGGFMRTAGPYGHAIALGIMMAFGFRIARWLEWTGEWRDRMPFLPISKIRFCELGIVAGSIMSLSIGPWMGAACGAVAVAVLRAPNRKRAIISLVLVVGLIGVPSFTAFKRYISVDPAIARATGDRIQEDSAYRSLLLPLYIPVVEERATWGWGRNEFPVINGMGSIDNAYLLVALMWGVYALAIFVAMCIWPPIRLAIYSLPLRRDDPRAVAAFTLIGIFVLNTFENFEGSGGGIPWRFLFVLAGWSTALLSQTVPQVVEVKAAKTSPRTRQVGFRRVMV